MSEVATPSPKSKNQTAKGMIFSCYPSERAELLRLQRKLNYRTPFDVIREALLGMPGVKESEIEAPRVKQ